MGIGNAAGNHYGMLVVSTPSSTSTSTPGGGKAVLNVTVKDHSSLAVITGVTVTLMTADASQSVGSEVTDATGVASFGGLADGDYVLNTTKTGYDQSSADATISGQNTASVTMYLDVTTGISINVDAQDTSDGSYIANAQITVKNTSTGWSKTLYTPPGGVPVYATFGLPGLGGYEISASAIGYLSASTTVSVQNGHTYTVTLGRTGWRVMIQVVDAITGKDLGRDGHLQ